MRRESHAQFCERPMVQVQRPTHPRWRCPHFHRPGAHRAVDRSFCGDRRVRRAHYGAVRTCRIGKAGTAPTSTNGQVSYRHRAPHRAGHACRGSIPPIADLVHVPARPNRPKRLPGCFCVGAATLRCSSAAAATAARSTVPKDVRGTPGATRNVRPASATRRAAGAAWSMPRVPVAIAPDKRT